jgi:adenylyltransferase/sulfurtransferase
MSFNFKEFKRFEKQIILKKVGVFGQKKIKKAKILIIGMGGLGCPLLAYLAASGIGNIGIVDPDKVELSNLNRQILFNKSDLNKYKVLQARNKIIQIYKNIKIKTFKLKLSEKNIKSIFKSYEIICDGTDNYETRYLINDFCKNNKRILISGAISRFDGHLFKFDFKKKGPCYRCFMPEHPTFENNCENEGIFSPVAGIIGSLQANEVLKSVLNLKEDLNKNMLIFDSLKMSLRKVKISINKKCLNKCKN